MKNLQNSLKLFLLFLTISLYSCQKDSVSIQPEEIIKNVDKDVSFQKNRLVFENELAFNNLVKKIREFSDIEKKAWADSFEHKSLQNYYDTNQEGEILGLENPIFKTSLEVKPYVPDNVFAYILNKDGLYQIGNEIHQVKVGEELVVNIKYENLLTTNPSSNYISKHSCKVEISNLPADSKHIVKSGKVLGDVVTGELLFPNGVYVQAVLSNSNWLIYRSYTAKAYTLNFNASGSPWAWFSYKAEKIKISGAYFINGAWTNSYGSNSAECASCAGVQVFLGEGWGIPDPFNYSATGGVSVTATINGVTLTN
jgi:hypothetical protein